MRKQKVDSQRNPVMTFGQTGNSTPAKGGSAYRGKEHEEQKVILTQPVGYPK